MTHSPETPSRHENKSPLFLDRFFDRNKLRTAATSTALALWLSACARIDTANATTLDQTVRNTDAVTLRADLENTSLTEEDIQSLAAQQPEPTPTSTPRVTPAPSPTPRPTNTPESGSTVTSKEISVSFAIPTAANGARVRKEANLQSDALITIPQNEPSAILTGETARDSEGYVWHAVAAAEPNAGWNSGWMREDVFREVEGTITLPDANSNTGGPVSVDQATPPAAESDATSAESVSSPSNSREFSFFPDAEYTENVTATVVIFTEPTSVHKQPNETSDVIAEKSWFIVNETAAGPIKNGDFIQVKLQSKDASGKYVFAAGWVKTDAQTQLLSNQVVELAKNAPETTSSVETEAGIHAEVTIIAANNDPLLKNLVIDQDKFDIFITEMIVSYLQRAGSRITDANVNWGDSAAVKTWLKTNPEVVLPFLTRYYAEDYAEWEAVERNDLSVHIGQIKLVSASAQIWSQYVTWWNSGKNSNDYPNDQVRAFAEEVGLADPRDFVNQGNNTVPGAFSQRAAVLSIIDKDNNLKIIQAMDNSRIRVDDPRISGVGMELLLNMLAAQFISATYDETPQNEAWSYSTNTTHAFPWWEKYWKNGTIATTSFD